MADASDSRQCEMLLANAMSDDERQQVASFSEFLWRVQRVAWLYNVVQLNVFQERQDE